MSHSPSLLFYNITCRQRDYEISAKLKYCYQMILRAPMYLQYCIKDMKTFEKQGFLFFSIVCTTDNVDLRVSGKDVLENKKIYIYFYTNHEHQTFKINLPVEIFGKIPQEVFIEIQTEAAFRKCFSKQLLLKIL